MRAGLNTVLAAVSRSFYLTIRILPLALRDPVGLAYLLARLSDTIADSASAPPAERLAALQQMGEAVCGHVPMPDLTRFASGVPDPAERKLLSHAGELLKLLTATEPGDREEIIRVMKEILRGQQLDVSRFGREEGWSATSGRAGQGQQLNGVRFLATAAELEDYTYSVAGCVGIFWTRICSRHLRRYAPGIDPETLSQLGESFGKGLQLVNILRDAPADWANGRCYLPAEELGAIAPEALEKTPSLARPVYDCWMAHARERLDDGLRYVEAVRPWRLRLACFLPWALGVRTLRMMQLSRPLETPERIKVSRKEVRRLLALGLLGAIGNFALRPIAARVQKP